MTERATIGMLWVEGPLSFIEVLCVQSFLDAGHRVEFYHYGDVPNIPDGADVRDANAILSGTTILTHERTGSPAPHSDAFRYRMLAARPGIVWADTDAYCRAPFVPLDGYFCGWESDSKINNGVLALPPDSQTLQRLVDFTSDPCAIPPWYGPAYADWLRQESERGAPKTAGDQPWGVWGPDALTYFLHETGEYRYAQPRDALYPVPFSERRRIAKKNTGIEARLSERSVSIHLYGRRMRRFVAQKFGGVPPRDGLLGQLLTRHGIVPEDHPLPPDCFIVRTDDAKARPGPAFRFTLSPALHSLAQRV